MHLEMRTVKEYVLSCGQLLLSAAKPEDSLSCTRVCNGYVLKNLPRSRISFEAPSYLHEAFHTIDRHSCTGENLNYGGSEIGKGRPQHRRYGWDIQPRAGRNQAARWWWSNLAKITCAFYTVDLCVPWDRAPVRGVRRLGRRGRGLERGGGAYTSSTARCPTRFK